ncbi:hypothetical protein B9J07_03590 [Sinorhizobium sp. LM21]|nr:hypothetical protein B9J07_03590 [Sinorhizobium sp. LM21]
MPRRPQAYAFWHRPTTGCSPPCKPGSDPKSRATPDGKPLRTFPGIRSLGWRNSGWKTASHFSWNSLAWLAQLRTENRFALFLVLLAWLAQLRTENRFALFLELLLGDELREAFRSR